MKIDAHQHFWTTKRSDYGWLTPELKELYRDFMPEDLIPILDRKGIDGTILVQAAPTIEETYFLLELADTHNEIKGVIGWVDFESADATEDLRKLAEHKKLLGIRPMIQDIPDDGWMLNPAFDPVFKQMEKLGLVFEALVFPRHLKNLLTLLRKYPNLKTVIDHGAKPDIEGKTLSNWKEDMIRLSEETQAYCKFSGLVTEAGSNWSIDEIRPFAEALLFIFGSSRLMWGSDWPVCLLAINYDHWLSTSKELIDSTPGATTDIFGETARRFYGI